MPLIPTVPRTYADAHSKFTVLLGYTGDLDAISADVLNEGIDGSCRVTKEGTRYSATDSATETGDAALCDEGAPETLGNSNYEGRMETFRYFNVENPGAADPEADEIFQALKIKGTSAVIVIRETNKRYDLDWEAGDEYSAFRVEADNWQRQQNMTGYIKRTIPTPVQSAVLNGVVAETAGG